MRWRGETGDWGGCESFIGRHYRTVRGNLQLKQQVSVQNAAKPLILRDLGQRLQYQGV
jgi:hypothetical protein